MTEKEKVVPSASVGADAGRPIPYEPESSIAETELPDKQNFSETLRVCLFHDNVSSVGKGKCPRQIQPETDSFYCQTGFLLRRCCHAHITARRIE